MSFSWAVIVAYVVGMAVAFLLNSLFIFPKSRKPKIRQARDFTIVNLIFLPVVWTVAVYLESVFRSLGLFEYTQAVAHAVAVAVPTFVTFLIYKFFAFKDSSRGWE